MKHALPAHLTRARWLADTLPPARIICATTPAALDVLLYCPPATIETVADPQNRILAFFDALRDDPIGLIENLTDAGQSLQQIDIASYVLARAQPEPSTVRQGPDLFPINARVDLLARRLLAMQFDTDSCAGMIRRYDTPDALLVVLQPLTSEIPEIETAVRGCTGQVAIATTVGATHPWLGRNGLTHTAVNLEARTRLYTTFPL